MGLRSPPCNVAGRLTWNDTDSGSSPAVIVRAEEALIVLLVLLLWLGAIALFFNRWGKIRMLEPYQPKFQQQHRVSCPMVDMTGMQHRTFSKFNLNLMSDLPPGSHRPLLRPRQNSVFVGGSGYMVAPPMGPPRKVKSAADLQSLVLDASPPSDSVCRLDAFRVTHV